MSVLDVLDATRLCSRSDRLADPAAWSLAPAQVAPPARPANAVPDVAHSWWSLARNPQALLLTSVISAGLVRDVLAGAGRRITQV